MFEFRDELQWLFGMDEILGLLREDRGDRERSETNRQPRQAVRGVSVVSPLTLRIHSNHFPSLGGVGSDGPRH
jgi:hypothetical protein